tara:strand:+ start:886 stop:1149 length:264 start_codon:yes stop_codon:yes gene_type:complete
MIVLGGTTQTMSLGDGDGVQQCEVSEAAIPHSVPDYTTAGILLPDGRVAVVMVLDDRGEGVPADASNVNGSTVASRIRNAYDAARGL